MERPERKKVVERKLGEIGETLPTWTKKAGVSQRIVEDLIDGKLMGTRGVSLQTREKMEETFGKIFDDEQ